MFKNWLSQHNEFKVNEKGTSTLYVGLYEANFARQIKLVVPKLTPTPLEYISKLLRVLSRFKRAFAIGKAGASPVAASISSYRIVNRGFEAYAG
jgi:hypothetical protein